MDGTTGGGLSFRLLRDPFDAGGDARSTLDPPCETCGFGGLTVWLPELSSSIVSGRVSGVFGIIGSGGSGVEVVIGVSRGVRGSTSWRGSLECDSSARTVC